MSSNHTIDVPPETDSPITPLPPLVKLIIRFFGLFCLIYLIVFLITFGIMTQLTEIGNVHFINEFLSTTAPYVSATVGGIGLGATFYAIQQKRVSDGRNEFYSQLQWAISRCDTSESLVQKQSSIAFIKVILTSRSVGSDEQEFVQQVNEYVNSTQEALKQQISASSQEETIEKKPNTAHRVKLCLDQKGAWIHDYRRTITSYIPKRLRATQ